MYRAGVEGGGVGASHVFADEVAVEPFGEAHRLCRASAITTADGASRVSPSSMSQRAFCSSRPSVQPAGPGAVQAEGFGEQVEPASHHAQRLALRDDDVVPPAVQGGPQVEPRIAA